MGFNAISKVLKETIDLTLFFLADGESLSIEFNSKQRYQTRETQHETKPYHVRKIFITLLPVLINAGKSSSLKPLLNDA